MRDRVSVSARSLASWGSWRRSSILFHSLGVQGCGVSGWGDSNYWLNTPHPDQLLVWSPQPFSCWGPTNYYAQTPHPPTPHPWTPELLLRPEGHPNRIPRNPRLLVLLLLWTISINIIIIIISMIVSSSKSCFVQKVILFGFPATRWAIAAFSSLKERARSCNMIWYGGMLCYSVSCCSIVCNIIT